ncbi:hypothetical protein JQR85_13560 [Stutzerimonas urumqiensis]|uniref:Bbp19 family protein n=1 Tax=Stutzerimonas urumqiensis TaxID=638269 RepID=UPI003DA62430
MTNASDERSLKKAEREERLSRETQEADFKWLMGDPRGRRIVWRLMARCKVFEPVFNTHGGVMNFNEGRRDTGLFLLGEIDRLCPAQFAVMAAENARQPEETEPND